MANYNARRRTSTATAGVLARYARASLFMILCFAALGGALALAA